MKLLPSEALGDINRTQRQALVGGAIALVVCIVGALGSPAEFFRAYLAVYMFVLGLALGSMALLMIYHLTGGAWGYLIRRILESAVATMPLVAIAFLPIGFGAGYLYPWAGQEPMTEELRLKEPYLNLPFFWGRAAIYLVLWIVFARMLVRWSRRQDKAPDDRYLLKLNGLSGFGLVVYGITLHFASVDWLMSLVPVFHSTIFGPLALAGHLLSALGLALIVFAHVCKYPPTSEAFSRKALNDLGNLLLTFVVIWAYMAWFQYMLIWIANLPVDIVWYLPRGRHGWEVIAVLLAIFHFGVPFFLLLLRAVKQRPDALAWVAGLLLFMQLVFMYYQVMPSFVGTSIGEHWMDFLMPIALGGIWLAVMLARLKRWSPLPLNDPNRQSAMHLRHVEQRDAGYEEEALAHGSA